MKLTHPMSLIPLAILILIAALIVNYLVRNRQVSAPEPVSDAVEEDVSDQRTGQPNPIADIGIEILSEGADGLEAQNGDRLTVHYTGTLENGTEFDSSRGGTPFVVTLGENRVIKGWERAPRPHHSAESRLRRSIRQLHSGKLNADFRHRSS